MIENKHRPSENTVVRLTACIRRGRGIILLSGGIVGLIYLLLIMTVIPTEGFFTADQGIKLLQVKALLSSGFRDPSITYPSADIDPEQRFFPFRKSFASPFIYVHDGKTYGIYAEPFVAIAALFYVTMGYKGLHLMSALAAMGSVALIGLLARALDIKAYSVLLPILVGIGTPLSFFAMEFCEFTLGVLCVVAAVTLYVYHITRGSGRVPLLLAGVCLSMAPMFRSEAYVMVPVFAMAIALSLRNRPDRFQIISTVGIGYILGTVPLSLYYYLRSGYPFSPHLVYGGNPSLRSQGLLQQVYNQLYVFRTNLVPMGQKKWLVVLLAVAAAGVAGYFGSRAEKRWQCASVWALATLFLGYAFVTVVHLLRSGITGEAFTDVCPVLVVSLLNVYYRPQPANERGLTFMAWTVTGYVFLVSLVAPVPDTTKLLLPAYPLLVVFVWRGLIGLKTAGLAARQRRILLGLSLVLIIQSVTIQSLSILELRRRKAEYVKVCQTVAELQPPIVTTNLSVLPRFAAQFWEDVRLFGVLSTGEMEDLTSLLRRNGYTSFWWVTSSHHLWLRGNAAPDPVSPLEGELIVKEYESERNNLILIRYQLLHGDDG